jgi:hypothetical protein
MDALGGQSATDDGELVLAQDVADGAAARGDLDGPLAPPERYLGRSDKRDREMRGP